MNMHVSIPRKRRMVMKPRISIITLGVENVAAATEFYLKVGLQKSRQSNDTVSFFQLSGGLVLAVWGRADLAKDARVRDSGPKGFGGMALAYNAASPLEVDKLIAAFVAAGARLLKEPDKTFYGGYAGYVSDPDGHVWEIAHNPAWDLDETGGLTLPD
jgi:catechol 2,3-dioxygenase-like lactoylglutathione lyase family enzyme